MNPIISPWLIWAIQTCTGIKFFFIILCIVLGIVILVTAIFSGECVDEQEEVKCKKARTGCIIALVPAVLLAITIPDKETATMMVVSSYVTEDNINKATTTVQEAVDYIFEKVEKLSEGSEKK